MNLPTKKPGSVGGNERLRGGEKITLQGRESAKALELSEKWERRPEKEGEG